MLTKHLLGIGGSTTRFGDLAARSVFRPCGSALSEICEAARTG